MGSEVLQILPSFGSASSVEQSGSMSNPISSAVKTAKTCDNLPGYAKALGRAVDEVRGKVFLNSGTDDITQFRFLEGTALEKFLQKKLDPAALTAIKEADKSLIDSRPVQKIVENIFDCKITNVNNTGKLVLEATEETLKTKTGRLVADTLGTTTRLGLGISCLAEIPDLYDAYENGDFGKQVVRSSANVTATSLAFGIVSHLAKHYAPARIRTLCMLGGAILGSIAASKATDRVLNKVMGESIESQKRKVKAKFEELKEAKEIAAKKLAEPETEKAAA